MQTITLNIHSNPNQVPLVGQCLTALCQHNTPLTAGTIEDIQLCVLESLYLIIAESYAEQPDQPLTISLNLTEDRLMIEIQDQGKGLNENLLNVVLNSAALFDPLREDYALPDAGISFYLLKITLDAIHYDTQPQQHVLRLEKYFEPQLSAATVDSSMGKSNRQRQQLALAMS